MTLFLCVCCISTHTRSCIYTARICTRVVAFSFQWIFKTYLFSVGTNICIVSVSVNMVVFLDFHDDQTPFIGALVSSFGLRVITARCETTYKTNGCSKRYNTQPPECDSDKCHLCVFHGGLTDWIVQRLDALRQRTDA